jgi:hypothetical protein
MAHVSSQTDILWEPSRQCLIGCAVGLGNQVLLLHTVLLVWTVTAAGVLVALRGPQAFSLGDGGGNRLATEDGRLICEL